jgi:hypothetical protein
MGKREVGFIKCDMPRYQDTARGWVKASVTTMFSRITKEYAGNRAWGQFMWCSGSEIWLTKTAKNFERCIGWMLLI